MLGHEVKDVYKKRVIYRSRFCLRLSVDGMWYIHADYREPFDTFEEAIEYCDDIWESENGGGE